MLPYLFIVFLNTFSCSYIIMVMCMYKFARSAQLVLGNELCQIQLSLGDVAVPASPYGVRIVVGHSLVLLARVEMEDALSVTLQSLLAKCHRIIVRCLGIFRLAHLYHGTAAVVGDANRYDIRLIIAYR